MPISVSTGIGPGAQQLLPSGTFDFPLSLIGDGLQVFGRVNDLDTVTAPGDAIEEVDDQSGNARPSTQTSGAAKPELDATTFDQAAAAFAGSQFLEIPAGLATALGADNWTIWAVFHCDDTSTSQGILAIASTGGYAMNIESVALVLRRQGVGNSVDGAANTNRHLLAITRSGGTLHFFLDGIEVATTNATGGVGSPSGVSFVGALTAAFFKFVGWMFEWAAVSRVLTGAAGVGNPATGELGALATYVDAYYE